MIPLPLLEPRRIERKWEFVRPLRIKTISDEAILLIHPPTGSWTIVRAEALDAVQALITASDRGVLDTIAALDDPLLNCFHSAGLLYKNGRAVWMDIKRDHRSNSLNTLILKMVGFCNLACEYCYDYNRVTYKRRLEHDTATRAITEAIHRSDAYLNILFHGGEPLLAFSEIVSLTAYGQTLAKQLNKRVGFSVQTNGTQFTDEVVDFLLENKFSVGLSLDGPREMNDRFRIDHNGNGHHRTIEESLRRFPTLTSRIGVLTTVTSHNVGNLLEILHYVRSLGIKRWDVTVFQPAGRGSAQEDSFAPSAEELIRSYTTLLEELDNGNFTDIEVRPVLHYIRNVLSRDRRNMCLRDSCCGAAADLVSISADGTIEACDCIKNKSLQLGSMRDMDLSRAMDSEVARSIRQRGTELLSHCRECEWRVMCGGTCLAKAGELDLVDATECALSMAMFPEILRRLSRSSGLADYARLFS